jgi:hypothetical protein
LLYSLARPSGNITGFSNFEFSLLGKWLPATKFEMTINLQDRHGARPDRAEHATGVGRGYRISAIHTSCARASFSIKYISDCVK